jgi:uncharacterized protein (TIGR00251 family)
MILVAVRVHPGASRDAVTLVDNALDVRLRARAVEGKANRALVRVIAESLQLRHREVRIARGDRSRRKLLEIELSSSDELRRRLAVHA